MTNEQIVEAELKRLKSHTIHGEWFALEAEELRASLLRIANQCRPATHEDDADSDARFVRRAILEGGD